MQIRKAQQSLRSAFTLTEMLVVVAIIVVLAGIGGAILLPQLDAAKVKAARTQAKHISSMCENYAADHGDYPPTLETLSLPDDMLNNSPRCDHKDLMDPWNREYQFQHDEHGRMVIFTLNPKNQQQISSKD